MNPAVFLVILCLAVASAAESPDVTLEVKDQEGTITNEKPVGNVETVQRDVRTSSFSLEYIGIKEVIVVNHDQGTV